jgi:glycosyltransferase involved in cell wall biosynthesis
MFSVVIPAYNCENTIEKTLNSVKSQTRFDLIDEIIVINDGATDGTDRIIKKYISENKDMNIRYIIQDNHGVSYTRNKGIRIAEGDWIALLDSDDLWKHNKIERQYEMIQQNPNMLFLGSTYPLKILVGKKRGLYKLSAKQLCIRSMPTTPSVVFNRKAGIELGLYNEKMRYCEDINFFQKFLLKDSYYILAEDLVEISIGKDFFAQTGLSSNLKEMHRGRNKNTMELYRLGLISFPFMITMQMMNQLKYIRRVLIKKYACLKHNK